MNRPVELSLLRLPLGVMGYVALLVLPLGGMARNSDLHETSIFPWILAGMFFYAPLVGSLLGRECSLAWGRATALLPVPARVRMIVIWWRRVVAPTILVWVLGVMVCASIPSGFSFLGHRAYRSGPAFRRLFLLVSRRRLIGRRILDLQQPEAAESRFPCHSRLCRFSGHPCSRRFAGLTWNRPGSGIRYCFCSWGWSCRYWQ